MRSPVDGVVGTLSVADRSVVAANTALMTVVDLSQLEVELEIPESYADDLGLGMTAEVNIGAHQGDRQAVGAVAGSGAQPGAGARALRRQAAAPACARTSA